MHEFALKASRGDPNAENQGYIVQSLVEYYGGLKDVRAIELYNVQVYLLAVFDHKPRGWFLEAREVLVQENVFDIEFVVNQGTFAQTLYLRMSVPREFITRNLDPSEEHEIQSKHPKQ